mmetsp:Transcript_51105/g.51521  ORF Transcript_51105/g.51521 Transcript_51105/m.51521 type:complete len:86 (+) Transcript_51105:300-557(+)
MQTLVTVLKPIRNQTQLCSAQKLNRLHTITIDEKKASGTSPNHFANVSAGVLMCAQVGERNQSASDGSTQQNQVRTTIAARVSHF